MIFNKILRLSLPKCETKTKSYNNIEFLRLTMKKFAERGIIREDQIESEAQQGFEYINRKIPLAEKIRDKLSIRKFLLNRRVKKLVEVKLEKYRINNKF